MPGNILEGYPITFSPEIILDYLESQIGDPCLNKDELLSVFRNFVLDIESLYYYRYIAGSFKEDVENGTYSILVNVVYKSKKNSWRVFVSLNKQGYIVVSLDSPLNNTLKRMRHIIRHRDNPLKNRTVKALKLHKRIDLPAVADCIAPAICQEIGAAKYTDILCYSLARVKMPDIEELKKRRR